MREPAKIIIIQPGWFTTVQDLGRYGYQQYGVSASGAMDRRSFIIANRLVGNCDRDAALEITFKGPELLCEHDAVIAITGADLAPSVNGTAIPLWTSVLAKAGSLVAFGSRRAGGRCYLAIAGGVEVPVVLGSRSTHISSRTGGVDGCALAAGDVIVSGVPRPRTPALIGRSLRKSLRPAYSPSATLRILPGPQLDSFSKDVLEVLTTNLYRVTGQSDRMGYRLEGAKLSHAGAGHHISDGTAMGGLQVPPDGQPILLMADRQTTGGYPTIAVVISADLHLAGQLMPGDAIQFVMTSLAEAQTVLVTQRQQLEDAIDPISSPLIEP